MREAVIVSAARTGIGKAFRGSLNKTHGATMAAHVIQHAVGRAVSRPLVSPRNGSSPTGPMS
jgi:acetyl-CoA acetyltransferase